MKNKDFLKAEPLQTPGMYVAEIEFNKLPTYQKTRFLNWVCKQRNITRKQIDWLPYQNYDLWFETVFLNEKTAKTQRKNRIKMVFPTDLQDLKKFCLINSINTVKKRRLWIALKALNITNYPETTEEIKTRFINRYIQYFKTLKLVKILTPNHIYLTECAKKEIVYPKGTKNADIFKDLYMFYCRLVVRAAELKK